VFSGFKGDYTEDDVPDPQDIYGRTKHLGEVAEEGCFTIRSSIVGHELTHHVGLLDWFTQQAKGGRANGFARALYSGLSTSAMADVVESCICDWPHMSGIWHVSSDPISKYDLLCLVNEIYGLGIRVERDTEFTCDRRLNSARFRAHTGWMPPSWRDMVCDMHQDYNLPTRAIA
jgi:dTDP-4-dehydrorhamnose reductase